MEILNLNFIAKIVERAGIFLRDNEDCVLIFFLFWSQSNLLPMRLLLILISFRLVTVLNENTFLYILLQEYEFSWKRSTCRG